MRFCVFSLHLILMNPPGSMSTTMRPAVGSTVPGPCWWCTWRPGTMDSARTAPYTIYVYYFTFCLFGGENKIMSMWFTFVKMFWHNWNSVSHERKFPIQFLNTIYISFFTGLFSTSHVPVPLPAPSPACNSSLHYCFQWELFVTYALIRTSQCIPTYSPYPSKSPSPAQPPTANQPIPTL